MSDPKEVADLVAVLLGTCIDWDGSEMADAEETRTTILCGDIRAAATTLQSLSADLERVTAERDKLARRVKHAEALAEKQRKLYRVERSAAEAAEARISTLTEALRKIASDEVETAFMFRLIASEALGALPTQGEQP